MISINKFKFDTVCQNPAILTIGRRGVGKSNLNLNILRSYEDDDTVKKVYIFSKAEKWTKFYTNNYMNNTTKQVKIKYDLKKEDIKKILDKQTADLTKKVIILIDDLYDTNIMKSEPFMEMLFNSRHYKITLMFNMQYPIGLSPELRSNFDYIYLGNANNDAYLKRLYDHYCGMFPNFEGFKAVAKALTKKFSFMVINNRGAHTTFLEKIFWYRSKLEIFSSNTVQPILQIQKPIVHNFYFELEQNIMLSSEGVTQIRVPTTITI